MEGNVNTLLIRFQNEIANNEVAMFRGAIINAVDNSDVLFHNHTDGDGFRYAYPLIQYKRINRKAAITCIGEGTEAIGKFFSSCNFDVVLGNRNMTLEVESVRAHKTLVQVWDSVFTYHLRKWLPLNQENYRKYEALDSIVERYAFLERLLTGNILSFAKSMGVYFDKQVECKITSADEPRIVNYKGVKMMSFDVEFKTNVSLPDYIGLGKGVSLGFGTVVSDDKNDKTQYIHE
jgi:CRISPR/Cas system endoribonuclease Cas6 (RAMP superfamily)